MDLKELAEWESLQETVQMGGKGEKCILAAPREHAGSNIPRGWKSLCVNYRVLPRDARQN